MPSDLTPFISAHAALPPVANAMFRLLPMAALVASLGAGLLTPRSAHAQDAQALSQLSLEDLMRVEVSGVSRKAQRLTDTAAAAYVLTQDDIARSGATSLPEVLRLVPGVEVARIGSARWAVSVRGFNGRFANKLLVQIDGRSIYSPLFSGVFWEAEDVLLEDIERIEVIRGPGAALWGANAVNGVINIVTRSARRTQGDLVTVLAGDEETAQVALRHGQAIDEDGAWRIWGKGGQRREVLGADGRRSGMDWTFSRAGARLDRDLDLGSRLSLDLGVQESVSGENLLMPSLSAPYVQVTPTRQVNQGAHLMGRLEWTTADGEQRSLQSYVDHTLVDMRGTLREERTTVDVDFQSRITFGDHDVVWGGGVRHSQDSIASDGVLLHISPTRRTQSLVSGFVHDEIRLVPERFKLILGTKVEHNNLTGVEWQPNLRALWTPSEHQTVWAAVARAVRTPSRAERDVEVNLAVLPPLSASNPSPLPVLVHVLPSENLDAERVVSSELGYRAQLGQHVSVDLTGFHSRYKGLRSGLSLGVTPIFTGAVPYLQSDSRTANVLAATVYGGELAVDWRVMPGWRLQASASSVHIDASRQGDVAADTDAATLEGSTPGRQWGLRSSLDLPHQQQLDLRLRRVGARSALSVPAYTGLDLRWAWRPSKGVEWSLVGENLLGAHVESDSEPLPSQTMEIPRGAYIKLRWQF